jgi:hypothetical protein
MKKGTRFALALGTIPFLMLVLALPLVNRIDPIILGLPFLLFWILIWVALTPLVLFLAYVLERKYNPPETVDDLPPDVGEREPPDAGDSLLPETGDDR